MIGFLEKHADKWQPEPNSGCYIWTGASSNGYGVVMERGKSYKAYRRAFQCHHGSNPGASIVRHRCDNSFCVNPAHLELGNHSSNALDMRRHKEPYIGVRSDGVMRVQVKGKFVGVFGSMVEAIAARNTFLAAV